MPDQIQGTTVKTGMGKVNPDHNLIFTDIAAQVITIHTEVAQGHNTRIDAATTGAAHAPPIEVTAIDLTATHHIDHITDHPHIVQLTTQDIAVHHAHNHPTNLQGKTHTHQLSIPADHEANHTSRRTAGGK